MANCGDVRVTWFDIANYSLQLKSRGGRLRAAGIIGHSEDLWQSLMLVDGGVPSVRVWETDRNFDHLLY